MTAARLKVIIYLAIPVLAAGEFGVGLIAPLGITDWIWFVIPLLFSLYVGGRFLPYVLAAGLSVLLLVGFFFAPPGIDRSWALISRLVGILVLWLIALMISHRKQTEAEVYKLSRAVEHSPVSIVITNKAGNIEYVNPKFTEVTGYSLPEVIGKNPRILKSGEMPAENYKRMWETIAAGGEWRGEFHNRKKNGELYWESASISAICDAAGNITHFLAVKEDITERRLAERQLAETLDFNRKIISDASAGILVYKASGQCVLANEAAAQIINATTSQLLKQNFRELVPWHASGLLKTAEKALATGKPQQCETHFVSSFGKEVWLVCHFTSFVQGNEPHLLLIFNDITERKKLEAQFLRAQRMESIGTLASGIAHDLNNVLTPLLISVQVLKDKITDADGQSLLNSLETNVQRGASIVKQVLAFGHGIEGERVLVYPAHIVREIKQIVRETFPKAVEFEFHSPTDLWAIIGDPTQIHQVLLNLCVNARDAMPNGGKLSIDIENLTFDETYAGMELDAKPGPYVVISVSDTGTGIPKEIHDKIFDPFFSTKLPRRGTGLGLSTTLAIVKSHGGFIHCQSEPGQGTTFKVYLPANNLPVLAEKLSVDESKLPHGHNELILVVDDEEPIRRLVQKALERFGYRVLLATDGVEAVSIYRARQKEIDVVITDIVMPIMDGTTTIAVLKNINPDVRIVTSSGLASEGGIAKARNSGAKFFIPKPYTAETMLNTLHEALHGNRAE